MLTRPTDVMTVSSVSLSRTAWRGRRYVRPILREKAGKKIEFGTKIGLTLVDGIAKAEILS